MRTLPLVVALIAASFITACGLRTAAPVASPSVAPPLRDGLVILVPELPNSLDPWQARHEVFAPIVFNIYDALTTRDRAQEVRPGLASEWRRQDALTWELLLRPNARTHAGQSITADMVVSGLERAGRSSRSSEDVPFATPLEGIAAITTVSDRSVRVRTHTPLPELPSRLSDLPIAGTEGDPLRDGTGPMRVVEWSPGHRLVLEGWRDHWTGRAGGRKATFLAEPSAVERFSRLQRGEADLITGLDPSDWLAAKAGPATEETAVAGPRVFFLQLEPGRTAGSRFGVPEVRAAVDRAIDRAGIIEKLYLGHAVPSRDVLAGYSGHLSALGADPEGAAAMLRQAGAAGLPVELLAPAGRFPRDEVLAEELARALTEVGFQVQRRSVSWADIVGPLPPPTVDRIVLRAWDSRLRDPTLDIPGQILGSLSAYPRIRESVDEVVARMLSEEDPDRRTAGNEEIRGIIRSERPLIPLHQAIDLYGTRRGLKWFGRADQRIDILEIDPVPTAR